MSVILRKHNRFKNKKFLAITISTISSIGIYLSFYFGFNYNSTFYSFSLIFIFLIYFSILYIKKINISIKNENATLLIFKKLDDDYTIFFDTKLLPRKKNDEIFSIILHKKGIFIVSSNEYCGFIRGNEADSELKISKKYYTNDDFSHNISNSCNTVISYCNKVNKILKNRQVRIKCSGVILFNNITANVNIKTNSIKIFSAKTNGGYDFVNYIHDFENTIQLSDKQYQRTYKSLKKLL